jgi:transposase
MLFADYIGWSIFDLDRRITFGLLFFLHGRRTLRPLSQDLRQRIIAARKRGAGAGEVCQRFGVSRKSVERFGKQHRSTGDCQPKQIGGYRRSRLEPHDRTLHRWISEQADPTLSQLQRRCREELNVAIGLTALWHRLEKPGLSYKKSRARRRARSARR